MRSRVTAGACSYWLKHLIEPRGLALREREHLLPVRLGVEQLLRGLAARARHDVVAVGLRILLIALAVLVGLDRIALRILHRLRHHDLLEPDADDVDAHVVAVERVLRASPWHDR